MAVMGVEEAHQGLEVSVGRRRKRTTGKEQPHDESSGGWGMG